MEAAAATTWPDQEWVRALQGEGPHARQVHQTLHSLLHSGLRRAFASRPEALELLDDVVQEAMMRIQKQLPTFRGESRFSTWAMAIAVRTSFDQLRRRRWRDISLDALVTSGEPPGVHRDDNPEKEFARQQLLEALRNAITRDLPEKQMLALSAEMKGMPQSEIGLRIGSNRNAVYKLTHDARKTLKRVLSERGITAETITWAFEHREGSAV